MSKRAKDNASAPTSSQGPPAQINDDSWQTFIMVMLPPAENDPRPQLPKNLLQETIQLGSRPKFHYMQKSELVAWAVGNVKGSELCRELKALVDADSEIPESLLARVFKLRLLNLKEEGLERQAIDKDFLNRESVTAAVAEENKKAPIAKKEDRGKTPTKKQKGAPTEEARPETAKNAEGASKRKNKIREKSGKSDQKPIASKIIP